MANKYEHEIPEGYEARIEGNKVVIEKVNENEKIRKELVVELKSWEGIPESKRRDYIAYLEKQKDASKAIEAVDRIDKYIDEQVANAHDMKDSNPDKKYYQGWDDALSEMAGILQDVYSDEKQKEQKPTELEHLERLRNLAHEIRVAYERGIEVGKMEKKEPNTKSALIKETDAWGRLKGTFTKLLRNYQECQIPITEDNINAELGMFYPVMEDAVLSIITMPGDNDSVMRTFYHKGYEACKKDIKIQKPAAWSEEDERMLSRCIKSVESSKNFAEAQTFKEAKDKEKDWLKTLPERFTPQPKPKWNEEDETMLLSIINDFRNGTVSTIGKEQWLKWLPERFTLQPKQEWSEEIREKLENIYSVIKQSVFKHEVSQLREIIESLK